MDSPLNNNNNNNNYNKDNDITSKNLITEKEASEKSLLLWETYGRSSRLGDSSKNRRDKIFVIRVFCGGVNGIQAAAFKIAMSNILKEYRNNMTINPGLIRINIDYISNSDVSERKWLPSHLIDYLLESDVHFVLTHIHQGLTSKNIGWIIPSLLKHLHKLKHHPGFPTGDQLSCPVFTQDKIKYINYLGDFAIPTFEIRIPIPGCKHSAEELKTLRE